MNTSLPYPRFPFLRLATVTALASSALLGHLAQVVAGESWIGHDRTRPLPPVVSPGLSSTPTQAGKAPADAVVLFDGGDLSQWVAMDGKPTKWIARDAAMECVPGSGYIRTLRAFGDCQLHVEFATPAKPEGSSQGRGNSGLFFGGTRYEIQILDSFENQTYADGSCASIYNQFPPLVNASRPPGEWQSYDIVWTAPRFDAGGKLTSPARATVFHNGVLVHNNVELMGGTGWLSRSPYQAHPEKQPLALQDHGNPVRYRNIWVRELGRPSKPEFQLADALLDGYCGRYGSGNEMRAEITRRDGNLILRFGGTEFLMFAETPTRFFAKTVDVQAEFAPEGRSVQISVGEDGGFNLKRSP
ncbi:MAG: family 16 glycoside hydrolase [Limisphaerales bacterium]